MLLITTPQQELDSRNEGACEAKLGPPSELAQACDRSMEFLLGKEISTGALASIAKSVFGKKYIANTTILSSVSHSVSCHLVSSFFRSTRRTVYTAMGSMVPKSSRYTGH